ncbi:MAG: PH domain-containing protein [Bacilli bacterium]|nr:PH domain-containing protein [Bacilli bacterium]
MEENKKVKSFEETEFDILWEDKPAGLWQRFLTLIHLNFTTYQITKDELIVITGFFKRRMNTCELYLLKDPDLTDNIYQRILKISTISVRVDSNDRTNDGKIIRIKNIRNGSKVRKLLRDAIEDDVTERKITYFDKV